MVLVRFLWQEILQLLTPSLNILHSNLKPHVIYAMIVSFVYFHNHLTSVVHKLLEMYLEDFEKLFVFEKSQLCHRDKNILSKFLVVGLVLGTQITIELNII